MKVTFPKDDGDEGASKEEEPKWVEEFCNKQTVNYIIHRCELLTEAGRYLDTEAIQKEFDY